MELWEYEGKPTEEEILLREADQERCQYDTGLWIRHKCPNCEEKNTKWLRQEWSICFDCTIAFTLYDVLGFYDVVAYEQDERPSEEDLHYILNNSDTDLDLYTM